MMLLIAPLIWLDAADSIGDVGDELSSELSEVDAADVEVDTSAIDDAKAEMDALMK